MKEFEKNLKPELDEYLTNLQAIFDAAWEKNMSGQGDALSHMVTTHLPGLMQTISHIAVHTAMGQERISIQTPKGTLVAYTDGDEDSLGITVELERPGARIVRLAMIEYTSGECLCGYDPHHPEESERERSEVPPALLGDGEGIIKPCLLCRSWPQPCENEELHHRTFHLLDDGKEENHPDSAH